MEINQNIFHKGINADSDYLKRSPDQWDFPTMNIRILNKDGQGLIITNMHGTEEALELTSGYIALGAYSHEGIVYLACWSESTQMGEIGCYPAPLAWSESNTSFTREYKPLNNYKELITDLTLTSLRTASFNFDPEYPIDLIAKPSYDDTVDIYIADHKNPNLVINSGFKSNGNQVTDRVITEAHFDGAIHLITSSKRLPNIEYDNIKGGGKLQPGVYFIFLRYLTESYARTSFIQHIGPLVIYNNTNVNEIEGVQEMDWFSGRMNYVGKQINIKINNLDTSFKYYELAIVRHSSLTENAEDTPVPSLISRKFRINPLADEDSYSYVSITGHEQTETISMDEIRGELSKYKISKGHLEIDNTYIGYNWKRQSSYDRDKFAELSQLIVLQHVYSEDELVEGTIDTFAEHVGNSQEPYAFYDQLNQNDFVGFFRGQIYPFAVQYLLPEGWTEAFPVVGKYFTPTYSGGTIVSYSSSQNIKGLYRFPTFLQDLVDNGNYAYCRKALGIKFDWDQGARDHLVAHKDDYYSNILGVRYLRGDMVDNLICQGMMVPAYDKIKVTNTASETYTKTFSLGVPIGDYNEESAYAAPLIFGALPVQAFVNKKDDIIKKNYYGCLDADKILKGNDSWKIDVPYQEDEYDFVYLFNGKYYFNHYDGYNWYRLKIETYKRPGKYGIFSPDVFLDPNFQLPDDVYVELVNYSSADNWRYNIHAFSEDLDKKKRIWPRLAYIDQPLAAGKTLIGDPQHITDPNYDPFPAVKATLVERGTHKGVYNFKSWFKPDDWYVNESDNSISQDVANVHHRTYMISRYIGINADDGIDNLENYPYGIFNIYKSPNDVSFFSDVLNSFDVGSFLYKPFTQTIKIDPQALDTSKLISYKFNGDCFYTKSFFRHGRGVDYVQANTEDNEDKTYSGDGYIFLDSVSRTSNDHGDPPYPYDSYRLYQYGVMMGMITENKININLRNRLSAYDEEKNKSVLTYFPKCLAQYNDYVQWNLIREDSTNEAYNINAGYNVRLPDIGVAGIDINLPKDSELVKPNRFYHSERHISGAILDAFRIIKPAAYEDFNPGDGPIIKALSYHNLLVSVQQDAVLRHFVNERSVQNQEGTPNLVIGTSTTFLSPYFIKISAYGSNHALSVGKTENGIYGVDWKRKLIWKAFPVTASDGSTIIQAKNISLETGIVKKMQEIYDNYDKLPDKVGMLPDDPFNGTGIVFTPNPEFDEAYFTFLFSMGIVYPVGEAAVYRRGDITLVYNELVQAFTGTVDFYPNLSFINNNILFSQKNFKTNIAYEEVTEQEESSSRDLVTTKIYMHDRNDARCLFYGIAKPFRFTIVVNGLTQQKNLTTFTKIFEALRIIMNKYAPSKITYVTDTQEGVYTFKTKETDSDNKFWEHAEYGEEGWDLPIYPQDSVQAVDYDIDSHMRGRYIKITFEWEAIEDMPIAYIKGILTMFNISYH